MSDSQPPEEVDTLERVKSELKTDIDLAFQQGKLNHAILNRMSKAHSTLQQSVADNASVLTEIVTTVASLSMSVSELSASLQRPDSEHG